METQEIRNKVANIFFGSIIIAGLFMSYGAYMGISPVEASLDEVQTVQKPEEKPVAIGGERAYNEVSFIVVHHTATRDDLDAKQMKLSMQRTYINNRGGSVIPTHYIIDKRGNTERVNPIKKMVGATLNPIANIE